MALLNYLVHIRNNTSSIVWYAIVSHLSCGSIETVSFSILLTRATLPFIVLYAWILLRTT